MVGAREAPSRVALAVDAHDVAAVAARVDETTDHPVRSTNDEIGPVEDLVLLPVAGVREVIDAADDLPDAVPDALALALGELLRQVPVGVDLHLESAEVDLLQSGCGLHPVAGSFHRVGLN